MTCLRGVIVYAGARLVMLVDGLGQNGAPLALGAAAGEPPPQAVATIAMTAAVAASRHARRGRDRPPRAAAITGVVPHRVLPSFRRCVGALPLLPADRCTGLRVTAWSQRL